MTTETFTELIVILKQQTSELAIAVIDLWPRFVEQQLLAAKYQVCASLAVIVLTTGLIWFAVRHWDSEKGYSIRHSNHQNFWGLGLVALGAISILLFAAACFECIYFINPEHAAFMDLLKLIR